MLCRVQNKMLPTRTTCGRALPVLRQGLKTRKRAVKAAAATADDYYNFIEKERHDMEKLKPNLYISDVISSAPGSSESLQWADLVMAGGGLLGIAHVGFVCILELAGIRFRSIGGTSAGAINATVVAAVRDNPAEESWRKTLAILQDAPFASFQDGCAVWACNSLLKAALEGNLSLYHALMVPLAFLELPCIWKRRGIHPGKKFQDWVRELLRANAAETESKLLSKMAVNGLKLEIREERLAQQPIGALMETDPASINKVELKLVASDVVTQTKVVFPEMANLYFAEPETADASIFVRASMSVPLFFEPLELTIPKTDSVKRAWDGTSFPVTAIPDKSSLVDGGTLSNFPISLFDKLGEPLLPTLGCQLGVPRGTALPAGNPFDLYKAMNNTSRHIGDYDFVNKNPIYKPLVATADTDGFGWLDFDMSEENKKKLFKAGAVAGVELLRRFQRDNPDTDGWTKIKQQRRARAAA